MSLSLADCWRRLRDDPRLWEWLPAGLFGGVSGGAGVAWLFWGWPHLLRGGLGLLISLPLGVAMFALGCAAGVSSVLLTMRLSKALRRLRMPPSLAMWEPVEPAMEKELELFSHPGCAIALYLPLIVMSGTLSMVVIYLALRQVDFWRVIALIGLGLPFGIAMAQSEGKRLQSRGGMPPTMGERG